MESQKISCDVCGTSFTKNKSLLRHVREVHQGMKRTDNEKRKRDSHEIGHTKIAPTGAAAEDTIAEDSTVTEDKPANARYKYHLKTMPERVICFDFVEDSPETEDLKMMVEDCFEELIRACIIDRSLVIVESGSKKRYTEEELTDWMGNREVKLMQEGKTLGQHVFDYLGNSLDCFEIICLGPLSVRDVFKEAYNVKYNLV